ncbi:MAG: hypothetical protein JKY94_13825 [Rhodobacteraceae bacterium]|nr:hypothetical protein [Paracoccaceae bacterium]
MPDFIESRLKNVEGINCPTNEVRLQVTGCFGFDYLMFLHFSSVEVAARILTNLKIGPYGKSPLFKFYVIKFQPMAPLAAEVLQGRIAWF